MSIKQVIRKIIPLSIRKKKHEYQEKLSDNLLKRKILSYMQSNDTEDDMKEVYTFLRNNPLSVFPYEFIKKYKHDNILVYTDKDCGMKYVLHEGKCLYFKTDWTEEEIQIYYNSLLLEQDTDSPHRYETGNFKVNEGDVVVDLGVAEGNFALSVVERAKQLYLFEADKTWIPVLEKTFAPWKDKVVIVNKYVSDRTTDTEVCLDDYFNGTEINFLKIDVEGAELKALGSKILSSKKNIKIAVCTYHQQNDTKKINKILQANEFYTEFSKGYMIFKYDKDLKEPYLRKGLIRARKQ